MTGPLLNDDQRRHLGASLALLAVDAERMKHQPGLPPDVCAGIDAVLDRVGRIAASLDLPASTRSGAEHQVRVMAAVWAMRLHDLRSGRLGAYGPVHPALAERLDPLIDSLETALRRLADTAPREGAAGDEQDPTRSPAR